ncbi:MAG TPA: hypothetical protein VIF43_00440 [Patescibacteria group bacterium]|jgi:hypothetical protein
MRDMRKEDPVLRSGNRWRRLPTVQVPGDPEALPWDLGKRSEQDIRDSWRKVAVFHVSRVGGRGDDPVRFTIGFRNSSGEIHRLGFLIMDREFGMEVGHEDVEFVIFAGNPLDELNLVLVDVVDKDNPAWKHLPLY